MPKAPCHFCGVGIDNPHITHRARIIRGAIHLLSVWACLSCKIECGYNADGTRHAGAH